MIPASLAALGLIALLAAFLSLRRLGPRYRVGRLLAAAPPASLTEAVALAERGERHYVRLHGRVSSDEEFPDDHDRPLVYRRRRVQVREAGNWRNLVDDREAVPFGIEERGTYIAVDAAALDSGLVVISREAEGRAADLPADLRQGIDPELPSRLLIEQVSAVEHAHVCGVLERRGEETWISAGLGRPLILTTLDTSSAMRVLARDHRQQLRLAILLMPLGLVLLLAAGVVAILGVR